MLEIYKAANKRL